MDQTILPSDVAPVSISRRRPQSSSKRVLLIENEWIIAHDLEFLLRRLGHTPIGYAANGPDAIRLAAETNPDLILMDIHLDGPIDGVQAAVEIVRRHTVPVIYLTANSHVFLRGNSDMVAPYVCIAKPFSEYCVRAAIESIPTGA